MPRREWRWDWSARPRARNDEAELLLREANEIKDRLDFSCWEEELAMAEFLFRLGRTGDANEWLGKALQSTSRYGPSSPLPAYIKRRAASAAHQNGAD